MNDTPAEPWLVLSLKWSKGDHLTWWRPNSAGYTCDIHQAGRYTQADAIKSEYPGDTLAVPESVVLDYAKPFLLAENNPTIKAALRAGSLKARGLSEKGGTIKEAVHSLMRMKEYKKVMTSIGIRDGCIVAYCDDPGKASQILPAEHRGYSVVIEDFDSIFGADLEGVGI